MFARVLSLGRRGRILALFIAVAVLVSFNTTAHASNSILGYFEGDAYGSYGFAGASTISATLGKSALIPCPCTGTNGVVRSNMLSALNAGTSLTTQQIYNTVFTEQPASQDHVHNTSQVNQVNLLNGLITANSVLAVADTTADATTVKSNDTGSIFNNLRIGASTFSANVAPNTTVNLPGLGKVILRETSFRGDGVNRRGVVVNMLHVFVTVNPNPLNLPLHAQIIVAHANSGWTRGPIQIQYSGGAWVANSAHTVAAISAQLGRIAPVYVGCQGSNGATNTNTIANLNVTLATAKILATGKGDTTAFGSLKNGVPTVITTATVQNANVLNGLITADNIKAVSESSFQNGQGAANTNGSTFVNLKVNGASVSANVAPNTRINLPGVGYVKLYERYMNATTSSANSNVTMIHVFITQSNSLGLDVGTEIFVAVANSSVKPF